MMNEDVGYRIYYKVGHVVDIVKVPMLDQLKSTPPHNLMMPMKARGN